MALNRPYKPYIHRLYISWCSSAVELCCCPKTIKSTSLIRPVALKLNTVVCFDSIPLHSPAARLCINPQLKIVPDKCAVYSWWSDICFELLCHNCVQHICDVSSRGPAGLSLSATHRWTDDYRLGGFGSIRAWFIRHIWLICSHWKPKVFINYSKQPNLEAGLRSTEANVIKIRSVIWTQGYRCRCYNSLSLKSIAIFNSMYILHPLIWDGKGVAEGGSKMFS